MSNHDIGRALSTVVDVVVRFFDEGKISLEVAREIIFTSRHAVHYCDGNEDEAIEDIIFFRCGKCLSKVPKGGLLLNTVDFWRLAYLNERVLPTFEAIAEKNRLASYGLCRECFIQLVNNYYQKDSAGEEMIDYFISKLIKEEYTSTGEPVESEDD